MINLWEMQGWRLRSALFAIGFVEDFCYLTYLQLAVRGYVLPVIVFVYLWQSLHDIYYTLGPDAWRDRWNRRAEKAGSALGAGVALWVFPRGL